MSIININVWENLSLKVALHLDSRLHHLCNVISMTYKKKPSPTQFSKPANSQTYEVPTLRSLFDPKDDANDAKSPKSTNTSKLAKLQKMPKYVQNRNLAFFAILPILRYLHDDDESSALKVRDRLHRFNGNLKR